MSPEMFKTGNSVDESKETKVVRGRSSDIWAAGITLYTLLTKKAPFRGRNILELAD